MWARLRRRHFDSRPLAWQFATVLLLPALLVAAGLRWGLQVSGGLVGVVLVTAVLCAAVSAALAHRVGQSIRQLTAATQQVRRSTQATTDPVAAVDARTVEVRLTLSAEGAAALSRRSNMQVQVAIRP